VDGTDTQVIVVVADASNTGNIDVSGADQTDCNELGDLTSANGITFERCMFVTDDGVSYAGFVELPAGAGRLLISVVAEVDDASLAPLLDSVLEGVAFGA